MKNNKLVIIGINDSHNASACVVIGDRLVCAIAEERIQRIKSMSGFPKNAICECLKIAGISIKDVDFVAVGNRHISGANLHNIIPSLSIVDNYKLEEEYWQPVIYDKKNARLTSVLPNYKPRGKLYYPLVNIPFAYDRELSKRNLSGLSKLRKKFIVEYFKLPEDKVVFIDHHTSHAYYAYYANPLRLEKRDFLVITADAGGDSAYESVSVFKNGSFKNLHKGHTCIVAPIYSYMTLLLGLKPHEDEYKIMGLAPYAKESEKKETRNIFMGCLKVDKLKFKRSPEVKDMFKYFQDKLKHYRFDNIAGGVQDFAEKVITEWIRNAVGYTGICDIAFSGGLALNIKINKAISELSCVDSLFIPPSPGDESLSIGACFVLLDNLMNGEKPDIQPLWHAYLGNRTYPYEMEVLLEHPLIKEKYAIKFNATADDIADILCRDKICAVFMNEMEFGPRALGHRSILADPSKQELIIKINETIKMRDFWMPFTPSILAERMNDYVINPKNINSSFMTISFDTTELGKRHLAAAIHPYDKTVRPQKVNEETSPKYYAIIKAFERKTGIGAVLNTSLNIHGKPILMKPIQIAKEILFDNDVMLENIYIEGVLLTKNKG